MLGGVDADEKEARAFCAEMLPRVSRTFALSIVALPRGLEEPVQVGYLLCRTIDTIEDDAVVRDAERERLFDVFDRILADDDADPRALEAMTRETNLGASSPDRELCLGASKVFACFRALPPLQREAVRRNVAEMASGMREFARRKDEEGKLRLRDWDDLTRYCYFVAGTVGNLLTALFEQHVTGLSEPRRTAARERAVSFGIGLQLVNIVKDVAEDSARGDCFLPESAARSHGVPLDRILATELREAGLLLIGEVCARAREHLTHAREYTLSWPPGDADDVRLFCAVPLGLALATLNEVEQGADTLLAGRTPKVSRDFVQRAFGLATTSVGSDEALATFFDLCERGEMRYS